MFHVPAFVFHATLTLAIVAGVYTKFGPPKQPKPISLSEREALTRLIEREAFALYRQRPDGRIICN